MLDGLRRHISLLFHAWHAETKRRRGKRLVNEADFLPAALEILEKPPSPVGRTFIWLMIAFFSIAFLWAYFGHVDVVASAQGRVIPKERVKVIQPAEMGVVRAIHVTDGQSVKAGDVLIELDPTVSGAEEEQVRRALRVAQIDAARAQTILSYLEGENLAFHPPEGTDDDTVRMQGMLVQSQIGEYQASISALNQQRAEAEADLSVFNGELEKLNETLPLLREQVAARRELVEKGLNSRLQFLELQERLVEREKDVAIAEDQLTRVQATILSIEREIEQRTQEFRKNVITELAKAQDEISLQTEEVRKANQRSVLQKITAPLDGVVQQLVTHTIGGVVQPAEPLMIIVPGTGELVVEAQVLNKDIGFVNEGDEVEVKLEAFPFTKYGVIPGRLEDISNDAIQDENLGLVYTTRVALDRDTIKVDERNVNISPGMAATAEIKTGKRRLIEFVLSPLLRYRDESMRER